MSPEYSFKTPQQYGEEEERRKKEEEKRRKDADEQRRLAEERNKIELEQAKARYRVAAEAMGRPYSPIVRPMLQAFIPSLRAEFQRGAHVTDYASASFPQFTRQLEYLWTIGQPYTAEEKHEVQTIFGKTTRTIHVSRYHNHGQVILVGPQFESPVITEEKLKFQIFTCEDSTNFETDNFNRLYQYLTEKTGLSVRLNFRSSRRNDDDSWLVGRP